MNVKRRLKKIEGNIHDVGNVRGIIGRYYDELTDEERRVWLSYRHGGLVEDELLRFFNGGTLHFICDRKPKPPTDAEIKEIAQENEEYVRRYIERYNSPEEVEKRRAEYEELQRIGALRKAAFERGESMSKYPLPWEEVKADEHVHDAI